MSKETVSSPEVLMVPERGIAKPFSRNIVIVKGKIVSGHVLFLRMKDLGRDVNAWVDGHLVTLTNHKFDARRVRETAIGTSKAEYRRSANSAGYEARYSGKQKRWYLVKLKDSMKLNLPDYLKKK